MTQKKHHDPSAEEPRPKRPASKTPGSANKSQSSRPSPSASDADVERRPARPAARQQPIGSNITSGRLLVIGALVAMAFFSAYNYAIAQNARANGGVSASPLASIGAAAGGAAAAGGGGCCGGGGAPVEGAATVEGDVQKITVDTSSGSFNPNVIKLKAGVPAEITFTQSGGGCLSGVYMPDFNVNEDLTGGSKTVKIPAQQAGSQFTFYCQMQMVSAQIVVE